MSKKCSSHWLGFLCSLSQFTYCCRKFITFTDMNHYSDVIMGGMASQITSLTIVCRIFRRRSKKTSKLRVTGLCAGNSPVTSEFPAQRASKRKMFPFDDVIMKKFIDTTLILAEACCQYSGTSFNIMRCLGGSGA